MTSIRSLEETIASLRVATAQERAILLAQAEDAFESGGFPRHFARRLLEMVDAFLSAAGAKDNVVYARGLEEGRASAHFLLDHGERVSEAVQRLASVRTPFFFERLPSLVPADERPALIQAIAVWTAGYARGINVSDEITGRRRLGIAVRRITISQSLEEIERTTVAAIVDLLHVDYAYYLRFECGTWRLATQQHYDVSVPTPVTIEVEEALMAGESVLSERMGGSTLTAPLLLDGELGGAFVAGNHRLATFFPQQHASLEILVAQASATMREQRTMEQLRTALARQRQIADALQQAFAPQALPEVPGLSFDALYAPAENDALVGGDWYDVFNHSDDIIGFTIGDVTGHGVEAAAHMQQVRQAIYIASQDTVDPQRSSLR